MPALGRGQPSDCSHPALNLFTQVGGRLVDAAVLEFQIFDASDLEKQLNPVQVYPAAPGERATVDVMTPCPAGDRLSTGHFVARWTPPVDEPIGAHEIRWFLRITAASPEQASHEEFEVLAGTPASLGPGYALVSDMRAEGVTLADATDARLQQLIVRASRYIERITGRFFEPRAQTLRLDGTGGRVLPLGHPVVAVDAVFIDTGPYSRGDLAVDPSVYSVYNRHLTQGLLLPDDRDHPKLELFHGSDLLGVRFTPPGLSLSSFTWPHGQQNITVRGVFGYTEPDGSPAGRTPELIRHVTKLLVMRELPLLRDRDGREDAQRRWRVASERTRDQAYSLEALRLQGAFTGDPEIDGVLEAFMRPPDFGAA